jgi:Prenyltransferase and squalene oxidase repeat
VTTSFGRPVLEATAWVGRLLGTAHLLLNAEAPDGARGLRWLADNQNDDGGWGSLKNHPSRVYHTCLAVQAIRSLAPRHSALDAATTWLMNSRDPASGAWGAVDGAPPTVVHTSWTLETFAAGQEIPQDACGGYTWLLEVLNPDKITDNQADVESYNIHLEADVLQGTLWHAALPRAMSALLKHPEGPPWDMLARMVSTTISAQGTGGAPGAWPNPGGGAGVSIWAVYPYIEALTDVLRCPAIAPSRQIRSYGRVGIISTGMQGRSATRVVLGAITREFWLVVQDKWTTTVLACTVAAAAVLTVLSTISVELGLVGIIFPILLLALTRR